MNAKTPNTHSLFLKWGKFEAGAHGLPAVVLLAVIATGFLVWLALT